MVIPTIEESRTRDFGEETARGNESARKQADLPVAKSAEGTNKGQVRDSSNRPPAEASPPPTKATV